jgi:hypothetical protein
MQYHGVVSYHLASLCCSIDRAHAKDGRWLKRWRRVPVSFMSKWVLI